MHHAVVFTLHVGSRRDPAPVHVTGARPPGEGCVTPPRAFITRRPRTTIKAVVPAGSKCPGSPSPWSILMSAAENQRRKLGLDLPSPPKPFGAYVTVVRTGNLVITAGQLPWKGDKLLHTGKLGT